MVSERSRHSGMVSERFKVVFPILDVAQTHILGQCYSFSFDSDIGAWFLNGSEVYFSFWMWYKPPILEQYEIIVHVVDPKSTKKLTLLNIEKRGFVTLDSQILVKTFRLFFKTSRYWIFSIRTSRCKNVQILKNLLKTSGCNLNVLNKSSGWQKHWCHLIF